MLYTIYFTYYELLEKANSFMKESSNFLGLMVVDVKGQEVLSVLQVFCILIMMVFKDVLVFQNPVTSMHEMGAFPYI